MPMRNWPSIALLVVLASALPGIAQAVEFGSQEGAAPTGTSPSGFVGVPGPSSYAPERYQAFPPSAAVQNRHAQPARRPLNRADSSLRRRGRTEEPGWPPRSALAYDCHGKPAQPAWRPRAEHAR